ncbi:MAG: PAS domain S-box protein [Anaerolineae bacterium]
MDTKRSILIVDDDPNLRKTLSDVLEVKGYAPVAVATGQAALDRVEEETPAVALIDLKLEDISGLEVMKEIKESCPGTECIVLTGHASQASAIEAINLGAYSYVQKPYDVEQLLVTIRRAVEKREAEQTLRESEENFRSVVENSHAGILIVNDAHQFIYVNDELCRILGYSRGEIIGHDFREFLDDESRQLVADRYVRRQRGEEVPPRYEFNVVRQDGEKRRVEISSTVIKDAAGNVRTVAQILDITEPKRAEEQLIRMSNAVRMSTDSIVISDLDGKIIEVNEATLKCYGTDDKGDLIGKSSLDIIAREDREEAFAGMEEVLKTGYAEAREYHIITKDGSRTPVEMSVATMKDIDGEPIGFVAITRDITERKRVAEKLRKSEERYRNLFESAPVGLYRATTEGRILHANPALVQMLGYPDRRTLVATHVADRYVSAEEHRQWQALVEGGGGASGFESRWRRYDGTTIWVHRSVRAIQDAQGQVTRYDGAVEDITERVEATEALKRKMEQLAALGRTSQAVTASLELDQVLAKIVSLTSEVVAADYTSVVLVDEAGHLGESAENVAGVPSIEYRIRDEGLTSWTMRSRQEVLIDEISEDGAITPDLGEGAPRFANPFIVEAGVKSGASLPLVAKDRLLGVLFLHSLHPAAFHGQLPLLTTFANQAAIAIENARLYEAARRELAERKQAEKALERANRQNELILSSAGEGIYGLDSQGNTTFVNPAAARMLGWEAEELIGQPHHDIVHHSRPDGTPYAAEECSIYTAIRDGTVHHITDEVFWRKDGTSFPVEYVSTPIQERGELVGAVVTFKDITERVQAEEALRRYTERLRILRAIDGTILAAWSPEETAQAALRNLRQLVPYQRASVVMFDLESQEGTVLITHVKGETRMGPGVPFPLDAATIEELGRGKVRVVEDILALSQPSAAAQALQAEGTRSYVTMPLIAQGKLSGSLNLGADSPDAFAPEHVDIAREVADQVAVALHQARLRAALEAEERRLEALVEHLPEGILLLNGERRILVSNPAAQTCLPLLADAAVGDVLTLMAGRPIGEVLEAPPERLWHELEVPGPPRRVFEAVARPVEPGLKAGGWVLVIRDVTEEREIQQRVQQQERLAAVGQLAGGIAHDFNNLLTTIMLYAQMGLGKRDLPPDLARALETIISESRQAAQLVQQILDFSRRSPMETHPVDLISFIKEAVRVLQRTIPKSISLLLEVEPGEYVVNADPTRIQQVLMNLVVNARDAMPGGGKLTIGLSRLELSPTEESPVAEMTPGEWVCLAVSDTGTGIPPEVLPHIFEPFFTTKPPGEGTGLGLAQVYGIVGQHEGYIGVETEVGQGATFRVYLPTYRPGEEESPQKEAVEITPQGRGEIILLVEDNERIRKVGQRVLKSLGYRVLTAGDGREALRIYQAMKGIELVITDLVMPEMGGKELIRELRKTDPGLKTLVTAGYILAETLEELKEVGILDVVKKPFDVNTLAEIIRRVLEAD